MVSIARIVSGLPVEPDPRALRNLKIAAVLAVVAIVFAAYQLGIFQQFADPASVKDALVRLGPWGYVAFVVAYAMLQPFGMPGTIFIFAAPLIWPWPTAFALSMTGTMAASVVGFSFARFVARDWIATKIPARFRKYDDALARRAFATVVVLRLVFWMPPLLHAFFGVSKVRFWTHFWGSLAGYTVPLLVVSMFGEKIFDSLRALPAGAWVGVGAAVAAIATTVWLVRRARAARATNAA
ncbi:MAG: hypothetical protein JWM74_2649 [Myxococcaceae bacterium]|nr:hypothetical protein [Myxococcaceae bacterium]